MSILNKKRILFKRLTAIFVTSWFIITIPVVSLAQEITPTPTPTPSVSSTPTPTPNTSDDGENSAQAENSSLPCTGAGCGQGNDQGSQQGSNQGGEQGNDQGGPSLEDLGAEQDEDGNWILPEGIEDTRQGAGSGNNQGETNGIEGSNTNTGADSDNTTSVDSDNTSQDSRQNNSTDSTTADASGNTGENSSNRNTGNSETKTGDAGIGVTQVKNNNTTTKNGSSGLNVTGRKGNQLGDLDLDFGNGTSDLSNSDNNSVKATNDTTGEGSENSVDIDTRVEENTEVQNDGEIDNRLDLEAVTGRNESNENTGDGNIKTGDAKISASLINLLNTTVINGGLWVSVADIFGDLMGNIKLPKLSKIASKLGVPKKTVVDAVNENTGSDSDNNIDIDLTDREDTNVTNDAEIETNVNASAITGQNESNKNTGGGNIKTGEGSVSASNVTVANTTVEGGNWGLVIVNSFNRWLGFLIGDNGETKALSQDETIRHIEANNSNSGANSDNDIDIDSESDRNTDVNNTARINNEVNASAITGQNTASRNTGQGTIETGNADVQTTAVNVANTTVKDASLFISVVNVMGNWWGDMFYDDKLLPTDGVGNTVVVNGSNQNTGANSQNNINVNADNQKNTNVDNNASIGTNLNATIDTGSNKANKNTLGGAIETGGGKVALNSQTAANLTGVADNGGLQVEVTGSNDTTGFDSENTITVNVNNERSVAVHNEADVNTEYRGEVNTGNNEASQNTIGGNISTGFADATVSIDNLINKVIARIAGGGDTFVDADLFNQTTGAESDNSNTVDVSNMTLIDIINRGVVNNLIDLILNTGGNVASFNTQGGNISTGEVCVNGHLVNKVNLIKAVGGTSMNLDNEADVNNDTNILATTGDNELKSNTNANKELEENPCPLKEDQKPTPTPTPSPSPTPGVGGPGGEEGPGEGEAPDEEEPVSDEEDKKVPRVLASVDKPNRPGLGGEMLKRFPVAGAEDIAQWIEGKSQFPWALFIVLSLPILIAAQYLDRQKQSHLLIS